jgi:hypothetical protein
VLASGCVKRVAVTGRELVVCSLTEDWAMESAPVLSLGATMHQDIIMHAVWSRHLLIHIQGSTRQLPREGRNCASFSHASTRAGDDGGSTSTSVITATGNAPMTP